MFGLPQRRSQIVQRIARDDLPQLRPRHGQDAVGPGGALRLVAGVQHASCVQRLPDGMFVPRKRGRPAHWLTGQIAQAASFDAIQRKERNHPRIDRHPVVGRGLKRRQCHAYLRTQIDDLIDRFAPFGKDDA